MSGDACERQHPSSYFDDACTREKLLGSLRFAALPAFMARVAELEAGHG
jgi:hypothetical protein